VKTLALGLFAIAYLGLAAPAGAQDCDAALRLVARGRLSAAEAALGGSTGDERVPCELYAWGRIAEARGESVRASALYRRAIDTRDGAIALRDEIIEREARLPAAARSVAERQLEGELIDLGPVPTLAMLREITRASMETDGWYPLGSVDCRVEQRVRAGGLEVAVVRVTAERLARDEELRVAVHEPSGWRFVASVDPIVQNGHGWRGAIELVGLDAGARSIAVRTRSWARDEDGSGSGWVIGALLCTRQDDDAWRCEPTGALTE
jgi:hypothetical protein